MRKEFQNFDFGPIIPMGPSEFGKAPDFPKAGVHPRLLFTADMIPDIRRALEDPRFAEARAALDEQVKSDFDGMLGIPYYHEKGRRGIHNNDEPGLATIATKAFMYAIYGDRELGYQAIDAMQNYLLTLNIRFIFCDQCRDFGNILYTVAKVYDWCYDLLTDDEKHRLVAGVTNYVVAGDCGMLQSTDPLYKNYGGTKKMEVGYPPRGQGCFTGHGSEGQITVHYMSGAIAFYDEHPDWWEFVAARYFNEFIPARNAIYDAKCAPQGISYGGSRFYYDVWAAFAHTVLFGKNPHNDTMLDVLKTCWQTELPNGSFWNDGDNAQKDMREIAVGTVSTNSLVAAAIYKDANLLAQRAYKFPDLILKSPEHFIYVSRILDLEPAEDRHAEYSPVSYIPRYIGRMIARRRWNDPTSPAIYMKAGERTTANHEHKDIGTFQIFYKDLLARDAGIYDSYGSPFSTGTIAHNGVTVFNPAKADTLGGWYSGGQRHIGEARNLEEWLEREKYRIAEREGAAYSIKDGKTEYAYLASNIAPAYDEDVEYLSRRMLSIFTDSEEFPMIFACYDKIRAASADYRKAILLQAEEEPKIEDNTVTLTHGGGKLIATYLSDSPLDIEPLGGVDRNRLVNGKQCGVSKFRGEGWRALWGRVEVVPKSGNAMDDVLSVMYVTDDENEGKLEITKLSSDGIIGATVMNSALIFIKKLLCPDNRYEIEISGDGEMTYYISGLSEGKWKAKVGKKSLTINVSGDERFARFTAPAGNLILSKM